MKVGTQILILFLSLSFVGLILYFMKKNKLKEEFSLLWFILSIILIVVAVFSKQIVILFEFLNPDSAGEILLFIIVISLYVFILLFTVKLSTIKDQNKIFTQEIAMLRSKIESLEKSEKKK